MHELLPCAQSAAIKPDWCSLKLRKLRCTLSASLAAILVLVMAVSAAATDMPQTGTLPGGIGVPEESELVIVDVEEGGYQILGLKAAQAKDAMRAGQFLELFTYPEDVSGEVLRGDIVLRDAEIVGTGDRVVFTVDGSEIAEATVIVAGDTIGNGIMSLVQVVRLTSAMMGNITLTGPYLTAGDFTGTGSITLGDVVQESRLLTASMQE